MKKLYKVIKYQKNTKGKYEKTGEYNAEGTILLIDFCNFYERKLDGEKMKIVKHYFYGDTMDVDVYFDNGWKFEYYGIPCSTAEHIEGSKLIMEGGDK